MKVKIIRTLLLLIFVSCMLADALVSADDDVDKLEPIIYEELKFKKNTDYLHDEKKVEMKNTIPIKQFDIQFDGSKKLPDRPNATLLFQNPEREATSTVSVKSAEIGLFTAGSVLEKTVEPISNAETSQTNRYLISIIFGGLIIGSFIVLITFFLPKLTTENENNHRRTNGYVKG